jgi:Reverse transcriptase (RNA-dependent DNA polymerase)
MVHKKGGEWRLCVDYRALNEVTIKDAYPLPRIDDLVHALRGCKFFTTIDLKSGYHQIVINKSDRDKTAFVTPTGLYRFKVMPFGLCNAPATFQRMMDNLFAAYRFKGVAAYLDDIVIYSNTFEGMMELLKMVLKTEDCTSTCESAVSGTPAFAIWAS